ncbi:MAG: hypothetical protein NC225_05295 [Clostridium sp.]|nr:hypothetical protein [Clostridium sp.]MCM1458740.1 hypothetical protein [Bacteroides sp.]
MKFAMYDYMLLKRNSLRSNNATQHVSSQISNVGILNGLVVKFKIHIPIGNMAVYEFKGVPHKP